MRPSIPRVSYVVLALCGATGCARSDLGPLIDLLAIEIEPNPPTVGLRGLVATTTAVNHGTEDLVVVGTLMSVERSGGEVSAGPLESNPQRIAPGVGAPLTFRIFFTPALQAGEILTLSATVAARFETGTNVVDDATEPQAFTVINASTAGIDSDGDGLTDDEEIRIGTSPLEADTDHDGMSDLLEVGPDSAAPRDTDADSIIDALDGDSDSGGESDRGEFFGGRDPRDPNDDVVGSPLIVTTEEDELDGGAAIADVAAAGGAGDISLREAITIANNRGGPDRISFDPQLFPSIGLVRIDIGVTGLGRLPAITDAFTVIDGTGAGVELVIGDVTRNVGRVFTVNASDVQLINLLITGLYCNCPSATGIRASAVDRLVVDRVRVYGNCGGCGAATSVSANLCNDCTIVDSVLNTSIGALFSDSGGALISGNTSNSNYVGVLLRDVTSVTIRNNTLVGASEGINADNISQVIIEDNIIENNDDGIRCSGADMVSVQRNVIRYNLDNGIDIPDSVSWRVQIIDNRITQNGNAGIFFADADTLVPTIADFDGTTVTGSAAVADGSEVVIYVDGEDEGDEIVGTGTTTGGSFAIPVTIPTTRPAGFLTATVTDSVEETTSPFSSAVPYP